MAYLHSGQRLLPLGAAQHSAQQCAIAPLREQNSDVLSTCPQTSSVRAKESGAGLPVVALALAAIFTFVGFVYPQIQAFVHETNLRAAVANAFASYKPPVLVNAESKRPLDNAADIMKDSLVLFNESAFSGVEDPPYTDKSCAKLLTFLPGGGVADQNWPGLGFPNMNALKNSCTFAIPTSGTAFRDLQRIVARNQRRWTTHPVGLTMEGSTGTCIKTDQEEHCYTPGEENPVAAGTDPGGSSGGASSKTARFFRFPNQKVYARIGSLDPQPYKIPENVFPGM